VSRSVSFGHDRRCSVPVAGRPHRSPEVLEAACIVSEPDGTGANGSRVESNAQRLLSPPRLRRGAYGTRPEEVRGSRR